MRTQSTMSTPMAAAPRAGAAWRVAALLAAVAVILAAVYGLGLGKYLSFEQLRTHRSELMAYVAAMPVKAVLLFIAAYALATALSLPGATVLTLAGGFLFGMWQGTAAVVIGATLGATALFLAARSFLAGVLRAKAGPWLARMEAGFREDSLSYMLVLRLIPGFPFFIVNLVPAFLGVPTQTFVLTTLVGIVPGTFVYTSIGAGLGSIFDEMRDFSLKGALTPQVLTALIGLAVLSLVPVAYKRLKGRRTA